MMRRTDRAIKVALVVLCAQTILLAFLPPSWAADVDTRYPKQGAVLTGAPPEITMIGAQPLPSETITAFMDNGDTTEGSVRRRIEFSSSRVGATPPLVPNMIPVVSTAEVNAEASSGEMSTLWLPLAALVAEIAIFMLCGYFMTRGFRRKT